MKTKKALVEDDEDSFDEEEEDSDEELSELDEDIPQKPVAPVRMQRPVQQKSQPVPKPVAPKSPRFTAMTQPERIGIGYKETGEVIAEGMPLWAAQMWSDLKNDIEELKDAIGRM